MLTLVRQVREWAARGCAGAAGYRGRGWVWRLGSHSEGEYEMAACEVCGNDYDKAFEVIAAGQRHVFDSFECAIQAMSPVCEHCGCRVIGHGTEVDGQFFCCAHCARAETSTDRVSDRAVTV
jgi:Rieske Fe-S protein